MISSGGISREDIEGIDAYVNVLLTAGTPSIVKASSNVSSITDRAVGRYTINFGTALASADYSSGGTAIYDNAFPWCDTISGVSISTTAFPVGISVNGTTFSDRSFTLIFTGA